MALNCKIIGYGSEEQLESIELRREILRKPLGLDFTEADLMAEETQVHIACYLEDVSDFSGEKQQKLVGVLLLVKLNSNTLKMRQVAVSSEMQGQGVGKAMVQYSEQWGVNNGYGIMELHARQTAVPFYLSLNYSIKGDEFLEVGIPHYKMAKRI